MSNVGSQFLSINCIKKVVGGLLRASIGGDVIADVLDAVSRKFTLFQLKVT